jgi:hypothetical protein
MKMISRFSIMIAVAQTLFFTPLIFSAYSKKPVLPPLRIPKVYQPSSADQEFILHQLQEIPEDRSVSSLGQSPREQLAQYFYRLHLNDNGNGYPSRSTRRDTAHSEQTDFYKNGSSMNMGSSRRDPLPDSSHSESPMGIAYLDQQQTSPGTEQQEASPISVYSFFTQSPQKKYPTKKETSTQTDHEQHAEKQSAHIERHISLQDIPTQTPSSPTKKIPITKKHSCCVVS